MRERSRPIKSMWDESFSWVWVFISWRLLVRITSSLKVQIVERVFLWNLKIKNKIETHSSLATRRNSFTEHENRLVTFLLERYLGVM